MEDSLYQYILDHSDKEPELLQKLDRQTHVTTINPRMLSGHLQGRILKMITQMVGAKTVLELGTFTGYSALCFAEGLPDDGIVHTIDDNDELEEFAQGFFAQSEHGYKIVQHIGKALEVIPTIEARFDLVFLDADKREYLEYYQAVFDKVHTGGYILADNTLWDGKVVQPVAHNDKQTIAVLEFNDFVANDPRVETVILPLRDGLTLIRKNS
ncbi:MAG: class I SAM-dependent methyltransferase [Paludibacteraceae bacterium]|nr:class I SAM-dependent methyltransferase [Paludibacteraceae bacterium]